MRSMGRIRATVGLAVGLFAAMTSFATTAQDKAAFEQGLIERHVALFGTLDRDGDDAVTYEESQGDVNFLPVFDDMDINRDGVVTRPELERFLSIEYGASRG